MGRRRLAREAALQALYLADVSGLQAMAAFQSLKSLEELDEDSAAFARGLAEGATRLRDGLDDQIQSIALNWELRRMAAVDRSLLRLAAYELLHTDTPVGVVIDEALELAKKFSAEDSHRFINGILDKVKSLREPGAPERQTTPKQSP